MRHEEIEVPVGTPTPFHDRQVSRAAALDGRVSDASIGDLLKSLTSDTSDLLRNEVALAKAEMREMGRGVAADAARMGVAAGMALVGALSLGAFLVIALGNLLGGAYWLSSLIVGVVFVGVGAVLGKGAADRMKDRGFKPERTIETLRDDKRWASQQARELRRDLAADPTSTPNFSR